MTIISIKLFLRAEECSTLKIESFIKDISIVDERSKIEGLGVTVKGKSDKQPVNLMLWKDHKIPELDPISYTFISLYNWNKLWISLSP